MDVPTPQVRQAPRSSLQEEATGLYHLLTSSKINVLLLCLPAGWACHFLNTPDVATFTLNLVALVPLAWLLGWTTEDLSLRCGAVGGGLINATFGNAPELILSIIALLHGLPTVALASLLGSVLSNLLLVLGSCFFIGGMLQGIGGCLLCDMAYTTSLCSAMLTAASMLAINAASSSVGGTLYTAGARTALCHATAILLILLYVALLISILWTHKLDAPDEDEENAELPTLSILGALLVLATTTVLVTVSSEFLVDALKGLIVHAKVGEEFLGLIVLPLASNATDHMSAVTLATKNNMNLALGCCLGSAVQVVMVVLPVLVLTGWAAGREVELGMEVSFILITVLATLVVCHVTRLGRLDWLQGAYLISFYVLIATYYALLPHKPE
ncbi:g5688 [Coccomyxa viridis]|uniref:Vacuolar cation/proton exchanger n=1 Tax=Coccomyxa viridis TaxID=1274662 RepID=A0ABP1G040_9CHLO